MLTLSGLNGLDDFARSLDKLAKNAHSLEGQHNLSVEELFSPSFMGNHTRFQNFSEFVLASPCEVSSSDDWVPPGEFEQFIREQTDLSSWQEMLEQAAADWTTDRLLAGTHL